MKQNLMMWLFTGLFGVLSAEMLNSYSKPLGEMDGFYRYTAVLGPLLSKGHRLREIPQWMLETDFPYAKRPYDQEIPFADGLSVVRLLGGWEDKKLPEDRQNDPNDLVFRDEDGRLQYRWNLLKDRLDPFVTHGYSDLTLVMDNVPWCFPVTPVIGGFGQVAPPADYNEWYTFIRDMCRELKRLYGEETVKNFSFRMGTEMQDHRRFSGSFEEYLKYYDFAAKAVMEEIPTAGFGPFNRSMPMSAKEKKEIPYDLVDILDVIQHCVSGTNYATGQIGSPITFVARSFYYFSSQPGPGVFSNIHPDQRTPEQGELWRQALAIKPGLSREVHELGPHLNTEENLYGLDTGARGAAQTLHTLINFKEEGAGRLWHWELFEDITTDKALLLGQGWLYSVMDHMRGGNIFSLPVKSSKENTGKALLSVKDKKAVIATALWNVDREKTGADTIELFIPADLFATHKPSIKYLSFNEENSVYDVIRRDLKENGLLSEKHLAHRGAPATIAVSAYHQMASNKAHGKWFIEDNWEKYEQLMRASLKLSAFTGNIKNSTDGIRISIEVKNPSVTIIILEN